MGQNISHTAIFTTKSPHFSPQSNIPDKITVISVKIFCDPKHFLVSRIPRYTIISTSGSTPNTPNCFSKLLLRKNIIFASCHNPLESSFLQKLVSMERGSLRKKEETIGPINLAQFQICNEDPSTSDWSRAMKLTRALRSSFQFWC